MVVRVCSQSASGRRRSHLQALQHDLPGLGDLRFGACLAGPIISGLPVNLVGAESVRASDGRHHLRRAACHADEQRRGAWDNARSTSKPASTAARSRTRIGAVVGDTVAILQGHRGRASTSSSKLLATITLVLAPLFV